MPFVCLMLLGIVEYGWLINNEVLMANATREAARSASLGNPTSAISTTATNVASPLHLNGTTMVYSTDNGTTWQNWPTDSNGSNGVPSGSLIKISLAAYDVELTGFIPQLNQYLIRQTVIMARE